MTKPPDQPDCGKRVTLTFHITFDKVAVLDNPEDPDIKHPIEIQCYRAKKPFNIDPLHKGADLTPLDFKKTVKRKAYVRAVLSTALAFVDIQFHDEVAEFLEKDHGK